MCWGVAFAAATLFACKTERTAPTSELGPPQASPSPTNTGQGNLGAAPSVPSTLVLRGPGQLLSRVVGKFSISSQPRYFDRTNLYNLINGGSESYISLGLKEMVTADYVSSERPKVTVTVEIYDMATPKNASARFARFLEGREDPSSAGKGLPGSMNNRGLLGAANASFWKDKYLVNITLLDESDTASQESMSALGLQLLPAFAKSIDDSIGAVH